VRKTADSEANPESLRGLYAERPRLRSVDSILWLLLLGLLGVAGFALLLIRSRSRKH
jgi:hypothetical protein